jgi:choline dehydrogenase
MFWLSDPEGDPPEVAISVLLLKPESRGHLRLRSAEPTDPPLITLPRLTAEADLARLAEGYERALNVLNGQDMRDFRSTDGVMPSDLHEHIRAEAFSVPHLVGTCAMGTDSKDGAVVDPSGRVHGTERLFVADASIMPDVPSGFTHFPTIMIAERLVERVAP